MIVTDDEVFTAEDLRLALDEPAQIALTSAKHDGKAARTALGLSLRAVPEGSPACDWCGSAGGHGGLEDESMGGPESYACADAAGCAGRRSRKEPAWADQQHPGWREDWKRVQDAERMAARVRLTQRNLPQDSELTALELVALAQVREMVEGRAREWLAPGPPASEPEAVELAAPSVDQQPAGPPPFVMFSPEGANWSHTLRGNPAHRVHTLGHKITHPGPCTHECAKAHAPQPEDEQPTPARRRAAARRKAARRFWARA
jgi:hypothetical protein